MKALKLSQARESLLRRRNCLFCDNSREAPADNVCLLLSLFSIFDASRIGVLSERSIISSEYRIIINHEMSPSGITSQSFDLSLKSVDALTAECSHLFFVIQR